MGLMYGLAAVLVIFEGIIIQCEGGVLPNHLIEEIIRETDYKTLRSATEAKIVFEPDNLMSSVLENSIIFIKPAEFNGHNHEFYHDGDLFVQFGSYDKLMSFFDKFGDNVKRIEFDNRLNEWDPATNEQYNNIVNCIKNFKKNLVELRLNTLDDERFWNVLHGNKTSIVFPEVKKFQFYGHSDTDELLLNLMFPKLETLLLNTDLDDVYCLENVKGLKELELVSDTMEKEQFEYIFKNNKDITKITLMPNEKTTVQYIAEHLTRLQTLVICYPSVNFLLRANNGTVYNLPSVTHFDFSTKELDDLIDFGNLSFDMPNLKKLTLTGIQADDRIINFIKHFTELKTVELFKCGKNAVNYVDKMEHIEEILITIPEDFVSLRKMFERIGENVELKTLKIVYYDESFLKTYKAKLEKVNDHLKKSTNRSSKYQWTLSHVKEIKTPRIYFMFRREPRASKSCKN